MQTFGASLVAALAASSELVAALPSPRDGIHTKVGATKVGAVVNVRPRQDTYAYKHPALAAAKAIRKFNSTLPDHISAIVKAYHTTPTKRTGVSRRATSGTAVTTPEAYDEAYLTNIQVGTPAQTLPMDFDTGSSDLWVFSSETASKDVNGQKTYNIKSSTTAQQMTGATWSISYGDGSTSSGNVYTDVVTIGNISVTGQAVESATTVSDSFTSDSSSSGLVGLAMSSLNTVSPTAQKTFFDNAKSQLGSALFTCDLKHNAAGTYTFGALDDTQHSGEIFYANLFNTTASMAGYWTFQSTGYTVGNGTTTSSAATATTTSSGKGGKGGKGNKNNAAELGGDSSQGGNGFKRWARSLFGLETRFNRQHAPGGSSTSGKRDIHEKRATTTITGIADTGTTLLMLPDAVVADYYSQVSGAEDSTQQGGYIFPCKSTLPDFKFNVGTGSFTVPGSYINWAAVDTTNTTCYGGIQSDSSIGFSIFGDIALKAGYVVFDAAQGRVGWAAKTLTT